MKSKLIQEPELQFGEGKHIDIRFGIMNFGVLDFQEADDYNKINLGVVGFSKDIELFKEWVENCGSPIEGKLNSKQPNLFPRFCGVNKNNGFYSEIIFPDKGITNLKPLKIKELIKLTDYKTCVEKAVEMFVDNILDNYETFSDSDVIICIVPMDLYIHMENLIIDRRTIDFHDMLKARCLQKVQKPIQLLLPSTFDDSIKINKKIKTGEVRKKQDSATKAWNFFTGLYYKSGRTPWKIITNSNDYTTCFIGISFYKSLDGTETNTSIAQIFNERGEGIIVRGENAKYCKEDNTYYLDEEGAKELLNQSLKKYRLEHKTSPARIVVHKTSRYKEEELDGFIEAINQNKIELYDFISLRRSTVRLFRKSIYPPLRGTFWQPHNSNELFLYTRGSINFYETYPGMYMPRSLHLDIKHCISSPTQLAKEVLTLTKMNWNNTQIDELEPLTIHAARSVGKILKYLPDSESYPNKYSYYM